MSGGSDGEVRLYNILEQRPILHWHILNKNGGYGKFLLINKLYN